MSGFVQIFTSSLGRKYIMALTGLLLGGFLLFHAAGNSFLFQGREAFIAYAEHLHSLGPLVPLAELALLVVFLLHIITGISLFQGNLRSGGAQRYAVNRSAGGRTWGSRSMPYTGTIILAFLLIHLGNVRFTRSEQSVPVVSVADTVAGVFASPLYTLLYLVGITALTLHISHGFWSLFQSLGLNDLRYNGLIRICGSTLSTLIIGVFFGIIVLFW